MSGVWLDGGCGWGGFKLMRRVIRILARVGVGTLASVCLAVLIFWILSYWRSPKLWRTRYLPEKREVRGWTIASEAGHARLDWYRWSFKSEMVTHVREDKGAVTLYFADSQQLTLVGEPMVIVETQAERWWEKVTGIKAESENYKTGPASGLVLGSGPMEGIVSAVEVIVPDWVLFVASAIVPALYGVRWWRKRSRYAEGRCQKCGYDLRASSERCPECGAVAVEGEEVRG